MVSEIDKNQSVLVFESHSPHDLTPRSLYLAVAILVSFLIHCSIGARFVAQSGCPVNFSSSSAAVATCFPLAFIVSLTPSRSHPNDFLGIADIAPRIPSLHSTGKVKLMKE